MSELVTVTGDLNKSMDTWLDSCTEWRRRCNLETQYYQVLLIFRTSHMIILSTMFTRAII